MFLMCSLKWLKVHPCDYGVDHDVRCRLHWDSAPWRRPWQQSPQHSSSPPGSRQRHGAGGRWPPSSGGRTWRRSCSWGPGPGRSQGHHALWLRPGRNEETVRQKEESERAREEVMGSGIEQARMKDRWAESKRKQKDKDMKEHQR